MEVAHAGFDCGEVLVGPVCGGKVGRDVRGWRPEEIEEEEEGDLGHGRAVLVEFC